MDDTVLIIARAALASVFAVSAVAKLLDRPGSSEALAAFSVPPMLRRPAVWGLPVVEIAAAILLVRSGTAAFGAVIALGLLLAFTLGIATVLRRGQAPACHCFGALSAEPIGRGTLVRNVLLLGLAGVVLIGGGGPGFADWAEDRGAEGSALVVTSAASVVLAALHARLLLARRRERALALAPPDFAPQLEVGEPAPTLDLRSTDGARLDANDVLHGDRSSILVFVSTTCGPCHELLPSLARWQRQLDGRLGLHVISAGGRKENAEMAEEFGVRVLVDERATMNSAFRVPGTPSAVEIDASGRIASLQHPGAPAIEGLIRAALKRPA